MATPAPQPSFVMYSARAAIASGLLHIEEQVKALELAVVENTGLAFDLAKTLVESACKTIIAERGSRCDKDDDLSTVFKAASQCVPFLPPALSTDGETRKKLQKTLSGLSTALQGVCELRNAFGFASHGSNSARPAMEAVQAILAAQAADAMIGFLYRVHQTDRSRPTIPRLEYSDNVELNNWIDDQSDMVQILNLPPYRPSEVLFAVDIQAYRDLLADFSSDEQEDTAEEVQP